MNLPKADEKEIMQICTYRGDKGTSGYSLSEEQFEELFSYLARKRIEWIVEELITLRDVTKIIDNHRADYIMNRFNELKLG